MNQPPIQDLAEAAVEEELEKNWYAPETPSKVRQLSEALADEDSASRVLWAARASEHYWVVTDTSLLVIRLRRLRSPQVWSWPTAEVRLQVDNEISYDQHKIIYLTPHRLGSEGNLGPGPTFIFESFPINGPARLPAVQAKYDSLEDALELALSNVTADADTLSYRELIEPTEAYLRDVADPKLADALQAFHAEATQDADGARRAVTTIVGPDERALIAITHRAAMALLKLADDGNVTPAEAERWFPSEALAQPITPMQLLAPEGPWDHSRHLLTASLAWAGPGESTVDLAAHLLMALSNARCT